MDNKKSKSQSKTPGQKRRRGGRPKVKTKEAEIGLLSELHMRFLQEYAYPKDPNHRPCVAIEAAKRVGLCKPGTSDASISVSASRLLGSPAAQEYLAELRRPLEEIHGISMERIVAEYKAIAFGNLADFIAFDGDGQPYWSIENATREQMAALSNLSITELPPLKMVVGGAEFDREVLRISGGISAREKKAALDALVRLMGYDKPQKVEIEHKGTVEHKGEVSVTAAEALQTANQNLERAILAVARLAKNQKDED